MHGASLIQGLSESPSQSCLEHAGCMVCSWRVSRAGLAWSLEFVH